MGKLKEELEKIIDYCAELYSKGGVQAVIEHVIEEQQANNPLYDNVKYKHCPQCEAGMPVLEDEVCLVCGSTVKQLVYGDTLTTLGNVRELIQDLDDKDLVYVEACDENGDVEDLYPMSVDVIENIRLKDGSIVREVRFCQRPNAKPEDRDKQPVVDAVLKQTRVDFYYGDERVLEELLKHLPYEILINTLPEETIKKLRELE